MKQYIKLIELVDRKAYLVDVQGSVKCFLDQYKHYGVYTRKEVSSTKSP